MSDHTKEDCAKCDSKDICPNNKEKYDALQSLYVKFGIAGLCVVVSEAILRKTESEMFAVLSGAVKLLVVRRGLDDITRLTKESRESAAACGREELLELMLKEVHRDLTQYLFHTATKVSEDIAHSMGVTAKVNVQYVAPEEMDKIVGAVHEGLLKATPPTGSLH